jgi:hypothetical protein
MRKMEAQFLLVLIALVNTTLAFLIVDASIVHITIWQFLIIEFLITAGHFIYNMMKKKLLLNYFKNK